MEREWRINGNARGNEIYSSFCMENGDDDAVLDVDCVPCNGDDNGSVGSSATLLPVSFSVSSSSSSPLSSIEHPISKFDTLAGVAIKYGVEVADVKKMNGLVTDFQMFGLKSLQIPLPGRHPPSPGLMSDGSYTPGQSPYGIGSRLMNDDLKWKSSQLSATASLQGFYGLKPVQLKLNPQSSHPEGGSLRRHSSSPMKNAPLSLHRKSKSLANCLVDENGQPYAEAGESNSGRSSDKLIRRRQRSEADFSKRTWKGLPQRPKSGLTILAGSEGGGLNTVTAAMGHYNHHSYFLDDDDGLEGVKKSSSTSNLHDPDDAGTSLWSASKLKMKSDLQALSTATVPKPITGRRNKAALD